MILLPLEWAISDLFLLILLHLKTVPKKSPSQKSLLWSPLGVSSLPHLNNSLSLYLVHIISVLFIICICLLVYCIFLTMLQLCCNSLGSWAISIIFTSLSTKLSLLYNVQITLPSYNLERCLFIHLVWIHISILWNILKILLYVSVILLAILYQKYILVCFGL